MAAEIVDRQAEAGASPAEEHGRGEEERSHGGQCRRVRDAFNKWGVLAKKRKDFCLTCSELRIRSAMATGLHYQPPNNSP